MACCTLTIQDETFGVPIEQSVAGATVQRGEWLGITMAVRIGTTGEYAYATVDQTYDVAGISVTVTVPINGQVGVSVAGVQFNLPWRSSFPGATNLLAGRFANADFMVFRDVDASASEWYFHVVDLRAATTCERVTRFGPYTAPSTYEINFCPSGNGQLAMLWHGTMPATVSGRKAWIIRTTVDAARRPTLLTVDDIGASGTLGCEVKSSDRSVTIFDRAYRQGNTAVSRVTNQGNPQLNSRNLASHVLPTPGKVHFSPQSVRLSASETTESFQIENAGGDYLEVQSLAVSNAAVSVSPMVPLPRCIWSGETIPVVVTRVSNTAASTAVTVNTVPQATPAATGVVNIQVDAKAVVTPRPALGVTPAALSWRTGTQDARQIQLKNIGNVNVDIRIAAAATGSGFTWDTAQNLELSRRTLPPNGSASLSVVPANGGPDRAVVTVEAYETASGAALPGFPLSVSVSKNVAVRVPVGSLRITTLLGDAPGSDIAPEGEFIEIINTTNAPLDLNGCWISHETRPERGSPRELRVVDFKANAFGTHSLLDPFPVAGKPLRILTRARAASDPATDRLRFFCNLKAPVWNNTGDVARIYNEDGQVVASLAYVSAYPPPGTSLPPGTGVSQPPARRRIATRRVFVNARTAWTTVLGVEDGDVVKVRDVTGRITLGGFLGLAGDSGPEGRAGEPAPEGFPVPGAPKYGLIGQIGHLNSDGTITEVAPPFFVGAAATIPVTISFQQNSLMLFLGVNDDLLSDNGGDFDCAVDLYR